MRIRRIITAVLIGALVGAVLEYVNVFLGFLLPSFIILLPLMAIIGGFISVVIDLVKYIRSIKDLSFEHLPPRAADFIKRIIKKMRYRKKVRADVAAELIAHFEDELKDCSTAEQKEQKAQLLIDGFGDIKLLAVLLRRAKKRCRPLWRTLVARGFQTAGLLILCLIIYIAWFLTGKPAVTTNYLEQLNRLTRPATDESLNAAPLYQEAIELYAVSSAGVSKLIVTNYEQVTLEEKQIIEKWLADNNDILDLVVAGSKKPYYWQKYENKQDTGEMAGVFMPNLADFRRLAKALYWRVLISGDKGMYKDAIEDIKACYRFGWHLKEDKFLIEQLVGIAIRGMAVDQLNCIVSRHKIDSAALAALQRDFEEMIADEDFIINFDAEKLSTYDAIQRCFIEGRLGGHLYLEGLRRTTLSQGFKGLDRIFAKPLTTPLHILFTHPDKQQTRETAEQFYAFYDEIVRKTPGQLHSESIDVEKESAEIIRGNILLEILTLPIHRIHALSYRYKTVVEATLIIIAILRYNQDTGDYPENLEQLVTAGYLKKLPIDSFSDRPLVYKKTDDSFLLYSVGENFKDDGGEVVRDDEGRVKKWANEGDWVFWPVTK